jgi:hypothetical protein
MSIFMLPPGAGVQHLSVTDLPSFCICCVFTRKDLTAGTPNKQSDEIAVTFTLETLGEGAEEEGGDN